jgi:hypothetical protein
MKQTIIDDSQQIRSMYGMTARTIDGQTFVTGRAIKTNVPKRTREQKQLSWEQVRFYKPEQQAIPLESQVIEQ